MARKRGDCAEVAARLVIERLPRGFVLCHGRPVGRGPANSGERYFHAWVENDEGSVVIDQSNGLDVTMPRDAYYAIGRIVEADVVRYTADEAAEMIVDTGHWGPWDNA
jgi:hypothetical protein